MSSFFCRHYCREKRNEKGEREKWENEDMLLYVREKMPSNTIDNTRCESSDAKDNAIVISDRSV